MLLQLLQTRDSREMMKQHGEDGNSEDGNRSQWQPRGWEMCPCSGREGRDVTEQSVRGTARGHREGLASGQGHSSWLFPWHFFQAVLRSAGKQEKLHGEALCVSPQSGFWFAL